MKKKRLIINVLVILCAYSLFIMWYQYKFQDVAPTTSSIRNYKIYLITMDKTSQYWSTLDHGVSDMAKLLGVNYIWDAPQKRNVDEQINIIKNAINNNANALIIAASDPLKVSPVIEDAKAAGIKIIYVDAPATEEGIITLATDNFNAGVSAGKNMISELESAGIKNGSIGIVGVTRENNTTMEREEGFRSVLQADNSFKLLETKYMFRNNQVYNETAESFITENPDLVGLFGTNEETTTSVGNAIKKSKKEIIGIGFDLTNTISAMIDNGFLKAVMVQNPYTMGYLGMAETIAALKGFDTGPPFINTGVYVKNKYSH